MNKQLLLLLLLWLTQSIFSNNLVAQNIGVKTVTPQTVLDVNGSVAMREGTPSVLLTVRTTMSQ